MFTQLPLLQEAAPIHLIDRIMPGEMVPIIIVSLALLTAMVIALASIVVGSWRKVRERQVAASLIQNMLDRNLSPPEIQQLIGMWAQASGGKVDIPPGLGSEDLQRMPPKPSKLTGPMV